ncbi:hypothetical protein NQ315_001410 [Exocentrus adspersus]|uniref:Fibronectin type-III domain-containing protein n=1 Tax=Exocentrus adspersus TaxID=1586481 RepID=A0AAV8WF22_9CUCU|nr:hypothetical protein NQ315_001410 [Exocentrus adspersus]
MFTREFFLVFVVVLVLATKTKACVPLAVQDLRIHVNGTLTWTLDPDETCTIDSFQVVVEGDREDDYDTSVRSTYVDLSLLKTCEQWKFYVTPVSGGVVGHQTRLIDWIPLPPTADLTLSYFTSTTLKRNDVLLEWGLRNYTHGDCTLQYRLVITDMDTSMIRDFYLTGSSAHVDFLSPCVPYHLALRAVNTAIGGIEGSVLNNTVNIPAYPEDPPELRRIEVGATGINMTWRLENYLLNRCPVENFYLDASIGMNFTVPILDAAGRPPVQVNLSDLTPLNVYTFSAYVRNSGGVSPRVPVAVQTLEFD